MIDDRVTRRNGRVSSRKAVAAEKPEARGVSKEPVRGRRTAQNKPERRRNYRFRDVPGEP